MIKLILRGFANSIPIKDVKIIKRTTLGFDISMYGFIEDIYDILMFN